MHSTPLYFEDTYLSAHNSFIHSQGIDETGPFVVLQSTIFYPQGGGQPSDVGELKMVDQILKVLTVKMRNDEIRHYIEPTTQELAGKEAVALIDLSKRILHAKLHTAGHLISNVGAKVGGLLAVKGHHFPGECFIEFKMNSVAQQVDVDSLNKEIEQVILADHEVRSQVIPGDQLEAFCPNLPYKIPVTQAVRIVRIGNLPWQPCGGTHIKQTTELSGLIISRFKIKRDYLKVYYHIPD